VDNEAFHKATCDCEHDYELNEEIGMCCRLCGHVGTEIKHVSAPFVSGNSIPDNILSPTFDELLVIYFGGMVFDRRGTRNGRRRLSKSTKMTLILL